MGMRSAIYLLGFTLAIPGLSQTISTVAGSSTWGNVEDVFVDSAGNIYAADTLQTVVYKIDRPGATTIIAGTKGSPGYSGDGALATTSKLHTPSGAGAAPDGTVYIADYGNDRIRKIGTDGIITTFAGIGRSVILGDGGPATSAGLSSPHTLALDSRGNLFVADSGNYRIRKISPSRHYRCFLRGPAWSAVGVPSARR
jgi:serine/threonine-protein kinase